MSTATAAEHTVAGVEITHPDRVVFPQQGLSKLQIAEYYEAVADWLLPHLEDRPLSLVRCPEGRSDHCFYQKHVPDAWPDVIGRVEIAEKEGDVERYAYAGDLAAVAGLVQMGVLELHVWGCRRDRLERPDRLVFDLDPGHGVGWPDIAAAARDVRDLLTGLGLESFVKTSGGKGLHVVVPIERRSSWDEARELTKAVARRAAAQAPERYVAEAARDKRHGKVFIDYLRNSRGSTWVAPYSTRARDGAPVSMPLAWDEIDDTRADAYTVANARQRLAALERDPWAGIGAVRQRLTRAMARELGHERG